MVNKLYDWNFTDSETERQKVVNRLEKEGKVRRVKVNSFIKWARRTKGSSFIVRMVDTE